MPTLHMSLLGFTILVTLMHLSSLATGAPSPHNPNSQQQASPHQTMHNYGAIAPFYVARWPAPLWDFYTQRHQQQNLQPVNTPLSLNALPEGLMLPSEFLDEMPASSRVEKKWSRFEPSIRFN
ncbi:hypothetical protein Ddc_03739 [Ditylenchus destructor]|nr:hypothetical protein Ddc_03739 [Ditylenchus destructor]